MDVQTLLIGQGSSPPFMALYLGNGDGSFPTRNSFGTSSPFTMIPDVADLNRDGNPDLIIAFSFYKDIGVWFGKGPGDFPTARWFMVGKAPVALAHGDLNNDGLVDVVTANNGGPSVTVLFGDGAGTF